MAGHFGGASAKVESGGARAPDQSRDPGAVLRES
jgi:hypothetical protein